MTLLRTHQLHVLRKCVKTTSLSGRWPMTQPFLSRRFIQPGSKRRTVNDTHQRGCPHEARQEAKLAKTRWERDEREAGKRIAQLLSQVEALRKNHAHRPTSLRQGRRACGGT
jgi:hypothetical protein